MEPYGCVGGDYWNESDGVFMCLKCGHMNKLKKREGVTELKSYFKSIVKVHREEIFRVTEQLTKSKTIFYPQINEEFYK